MLQPRLEPSPRSLPGRSDETLSERALTALRTALQSLLRQPAQEASLRRVMRALCVEARARDMRAEQLIVVFKRVWHALPEVQDRDTAERQRMLDHIITVCVDEFYAA